MTYNKYIILFVLFIFVFIFYIYTHKNEKSHEKSREKSHINSHNNEKLDNNETVFNIDGSIIKYPMFKECYFEYNKYYPELNIINENREIILEELHSI